MSLEEPCPLRRLGGQTQHDSRRLDEFDDIVLVRRIFSNVGKEGENIPDPIFPLNNLQWAL